MEEGLGDQPRLQHFDADHFFRIAENAAAVFSLEHFALERLIPHRGAKFLGVLRRITFVGDDSPPGIDGIQQDAPQVRRLHPLLSRRAIAPLVQAAEAKLLDQLPEAKVASRDATEEFRHLRAEHRIIGPLLGAVIVTHAIGKLHGGTRQPARLPRFLRAALEPPLDERQFERGHRALDVSEELAFGRRKRGAARGQVQIDARPLELVEQDVVGERGGPDQPREFLRHHRLDVGALYLAEEHRHLGGVHHLRPREVGVSHHLVYLEVVLLRDLVNGGLLGGNSVVPVLRLLAGRDPDEPNCLLSVIRLAVCFLHGSQSSLEPFVTP